MRITVHRTEHLVSLDETFSKTIWAAIVGFRVLYEVIVVVVIVVIIIIIIIT